LELLQDGEVAVVDPQRGDGEQRSRDENHWRCPPQTHMFQSEGEKNTYHGQARHAKRKRGRDSRTGLREIQQGSQAGNRPFAGTQGTRVGYDTERNKPNQQDGCPGQRQGIQPTKEK
jgi:hypothetical protein